MTNLADDSSVQPLFEVDHGRAHISDVGGDAPPPSAVFPQHGVADAVPPATDTVDDSGPPESDAEQAAAGAGDPGHEPAASSVAEELVWNLPGPPTAASLTKGHYAGRTAVGDVGEMERIVPRILPNLRGGHRPETMVDSGSAADGLYVGAVSVRGPGHHHLGTPRQDHYAVGIEGDWFIGVVADGVSEGELSHLGAERAAYTAVAEVRARIKAGSLDEQSWPAIGEACRKAVRAVALQLVGKHAKDADGALVPPESVSDRTLASHVATTCDVVVCALDADSQGARAFTRATISGDGSAYVLSPREGWRQVGAGKASADGMVDNSLTPLPLDPGPPRVTAGMLPTGQALVLCTDGFGDLIEEGSRPVGRYLYEQWARPLHADELLRSASFLNKNADDDRTAIILWTES